MFQSPSKYCAYEGYWGHMKHGHRVPRSSHGMAPGASLLRIQHSLGVLLYTTQLLGAFVSSCLDEVLLIIGGPDKGPQIRSCPSIIMEPHMV